MSVLLGTYSACCPDSVVDTGVHVNNEFAM